MKKLSSEQFQELYTSQDLIIELEELNIGHKQLQII